MTEAEHDEMLEIVNRLWDAFRSELGGKSPSIQGAVLADLTAVWLAGHMGKDKDKIRRVLLQKHVRAVKELIPINEEIILEGLARAARN